MKYFERSLPSPEFVRIHRSYIVNTEQILRVEATQRASFPLALPLYTYIPSCRDGARPVSSLQNGILNYYQTVVRRGTPRLYN